MAINEKITGKDSVAITGTATGENSRGVLGKSDHGGVKGEGDKGSGVLGTSKQWMGVHGQSESTTGGAGVWGEAIGSGVVGVSQTWMGVYGESKSTTGGAGVMGEHKGVGSGVVGVSQTWMGVYGESKSTTGGAGVMGEHKGVGSGVVGVSQTRMGIYGESKSTTGGAGVMGEHKGAGLGVKAVSKDGVGLAAYSTTNEAIHAETHSEIAAIAAYNLNNDGKGFAIYGKKVGNGFAGFFEGNVWVSKKLTVGDDIVLANADCAEDFDVAGEVKVEPGTVMVLGKDGDLFESHQAYDKRVAGVSQVLVTINQASCWISNMQQQVIGNQSH